MKPQTHGAHGASFPARGWLKTGLVITVLAIVAIASFFVDVRGLLVSLLEHLRGLGIWGLVLLALVYVIACVLFIPGSILTLGAGFLAAALWPNRPLLAVLVGTAVASLASVTGATLAFLIGRTVGREWVSRRLAGNTRFQALDDAIAQNGRKVVFLVRLSPVFPFNLLNYALGITRVRLTDYVLASWAGMLPATVLFVYAGSAAHSVTAAAAGQAQGGVTQTILFVVGLVATLALVVAGTRMARKSFGDAVARSKQDAV